MRSGSRRSHTAEGAAALRAAGARASRSGTRNPDHLAERLIGPRYRLALRIGPLRVLSLAVLDRRMPGLYPFVTARTRYLDTVFGTELAGGAEQVVLLGAGADSRAYRFAADLGDTVVFEVDHPATGAWKQEQIRRVFGALPPQVVFVPIEFNSESLAEALDRAGVKRDARTLFLWEGVTPYLDADAVDATLRTVAEFAAGSSIVFDYLHQDCFDRPCPYPEGQKYFDYLGAHGEPLLFGLDPATLGDYLAERGLSLLDNADPAALTKRHLGPADRPIMSFSSITHAVVEPTT